MRVWSQLSGIDCEEGLREKLDRELRRSQSLRIYRLSSSIEIEQPAKMYLITGSDILAM